MVLAVLAVLPRSGGSAEEKFVPPPEGALLNVPVERFAYVPGERLVFELTWAGFRAGKASMTVSESTGRNGKKFHVITSTAKSSKLVDPFYKVRDVIISRLDAETGVPVRIDINQRHGRRKRIRNVVFDQEGHKATTYQARRDPKTVKIPPRVHDILSCFYYFRSLPDLSPESGIKVIDVHEGKKNWRLLVEPVGYETIKVPAGMFDTIEVKAEVRFKGVFYDRGDVRIYLTNDERRIPVKVRIKIPVGSVNVSLRHLVLPPEPEAKTAGAGAAQPPQTMKP